MCEAQRSQFPHLPFVDRRRNAKSNWSNVFSYGRCASLQPRLQIALPPRIDLRIDDCEQEVGIGGLVL